MPILEIIQTPQTLRYNCSRKITASRYNIFATSPLSRSASIRVYVEVPIGQGRARGIRAAPGRLFTCFIRSRPADVKQNKGLRVCHRKFETLKLPFGNDDANFFNHPGAADVKIQPKYQEFLLDMQYFCNFSLVSLGIRSRSRRGAERIRQGGGRLSRPLEDGARTKPFDRELLFRESHTEAETKKNSWPNPRKK